MNNSETFNVSDEMDKINNKWNPENAGISRIFQFVSFRHAISFILEIADYAEKVNHHPTLTNTYNEVKLFLVTHTENAITKKDIDFCLEVEKLISNYEILN